MDEFLEFCLESTKKQHSASDMNLRGPIFILDVPFLVQIEPLFSGKMRLHHHYQRFHHYQQHRH
jgi:hypothetical protein